MVVLVLAGIDTCKYHFLSSAVENLDEKVCSLTSEREIPTARAQGVGGSKDNEAAEYTRVSADMNPPLAKTRLDSSN